MKHSICTTKVICTCNLHLLKEYYDLRYNQMLVNCEFKEILKTPASADLAFYYFGNKNYCSNNLNHMLSNTRMHRIKEETRELNV